MPRRGARKGTEIWVILRPSATCCGRTTDPLRPPRPESEATGGASDDIGDVAWNVPTIIIFYPSNIPGTVIHSTIAAMAEATPIAHKGAVTCAKAVAMTVPDLMTPAQSKGGPVLTN